MLGGVYLVSVCVVFFWGGGETVGEQLFLGAKQSTARSPCLFANQPGDMKSSSTLIPS